MITDHDGTARGICNCRKCGGYSPRERLDLECLRADITEALTDAAEAAIDGQPRTPEWRATYNAALTGLLAVPEAYTPSEAHKYATEAANIAFSAAEMTVES